MSVSAAQQDGAVRLEGRLDVTTVPAIRLALYAAVEMGEGDLEVVMSGVELVDASGLGVLVGAHRRAQGAGRRLVLVDVPPQVARTLFVTRLDKVLRMRRAPALAA